MKLIYVHFTGKNYKAEYIYEFIFTKLSVNELSEVSGEYWESKPAAGNPQPPINYVNESCMLVSDDELILVQDSSSFNMADSVQGIIALAWEDNEKKARLVFKYGEEKESVVKKLYQKEMIFNI